LQFRLRGYNTVFPSGGLVSVSRLVGRKKHLGNTVDTDTNQGSHYLLIPKDLAQLLEINDQSVLVLSIGESPKGQRLIYEIKERSLDGQKQK